MKKSVKKMWNHVAKEFNKMKNYKNKEKESLQPFYKIMEMNISNDEKLKRIYQTQLRIPFIYGLVQKRKGNRLVFLINPVVKHDKDKLFDELLGLEYTIKEGDDANV